MPELGSKVKVYQRIGKRIINKEIGIFKSGIIVLLEPKMQDRKT